MFKVACSCFLLLPISIPVREKNCGIIQKRKVAFEDEETLFLNCQTPMQKCMFF